MMAARSKLSIVPTAALHAEIERRRKLLPELLALRVQIDAKIAELGGSADQPTRASAPTPAPSAKMPGRKPGRKAKRVKNAMNLSDALVAAFTGKSQMGVADAADAVLASGYKSNSKIFRTIVNQSLLKDKWFKKAGRGVYVLKGKPGRKPGKKAKGKPGQTPGREAEPVKNALSLPDALAAVFAGKEKMGIAEAADAVQAAGYKTNAKGFRKMVNKTLAKDKRFKNVGRGEYALT